MIAVVLNTSRAIPPAPQMEWKRLHNAGVRRHSAANSDHRRHSSVAEAHAAVATQPGLRRSGSGSVARGAPCGQHADQRL